MSFESIISSPKAVGALALGVGLGVFGVIYMLFDTELKEGGDVTPEAIVYDQDQEIAHYQSQIQYCEEQLAKYSSLATLNNKYQILKKANMARAAELTNATQAFEQLRTAIPQIQQSMESYQESYRMQIRGEAVGESVPELVTQSGVIYKRVQIREVTPVGIQIRHEDGQKRLAFEELPQTWQVRFQFDPEEKQRALAKEAARQAEEEKAIQAANEARSANREAAKERQDAADKARVKQLISAKENEMRNLQMSIKSLETQISRGDTAGGGLSNPGKLKAALQDRKSALASMRSELSSLKDQR